MMKASNPITHFSPFSRRGSVLMLLTVISLGKVGSAQLCRYYMGITDPDTNCRTAGTTSSREINHTPTQATYCQYDFNLGFQRCTQVNATQSYDLEAYSAGGCAAPAYTGTTVGSRTITVATMNNCDACRGDGDEC